MEFVWLFLFAVSMTSIVSILRGGLASGADKVFLSTLVGSVVIAVALFPIARDLPDMRGLGVMITHVIMSAVALICVPLCALIFRDGRSETPLWAWWVIPLFLLASADLLSMVR